MKNCLKITALALLGVLILSSIGFAADTTTLDKTYSAIDKTNLKIETTIDKAVVVADILVNNGLSADLVIDRLIEKTDHMTATMIDKAANNGITVVSEYVEVQIGGQIVLVDPCRVINH